MPHCQKRSDHPQELYKKRSPITKFVINNGGASDAAYDIFQETILTFYDKIINTDLELTCSISTYLYSISKYKWKNKLIAQNKFHDYFDSFSQQEFDESDDEEEKFFVAEKALQTLEVKCRTILIAFYYHKKNMVEIAKDMNFTSENAAKNQKYKCLEKARDIFKNLIQSPLNINL